MVRWAARAALPTSASKEDIVTWPQTVTSVGISTVTPRGARGGSSGAAAADLSTAAGDRCLRPFGDFRRLRSVEPARSAFADNLAADAFCFGARPLPSPLIVINRELRLLSHHSQCESYGVRGCFLSPRLARSLKHRGVGEVGPIDRRSKAPFETSATLAGEGIAGRRKSRPFQGNGRGVAAVV